MKLKSMLLSVAAVAMTAGVHAADTYTKGYVKKDGTYVQGHYKTKANDTKLDNYSTKGNTNPYTGKKGTKDPTSK